MIYFRQEFADGSEIEAQIPKRDCHELTLGIRMGSQSAQVQLDYVRLMQLVRALANLAEEIARRA